VGKPRFDDFGRVMDVAARMLLLCGGDVVHEEVFYFCYGLSYEFMGRYIVELAEVA
jgi:hypothetical protein